TLIQNDKLYLDAQSVVFSGQAFIPGAVIENASIDGAKIADATIGSAKIASLDANKISTGELTGITLYTVGADGTSSKITSGGTHYYDDRSNLIGKIGPSAVYEDYSHVQALSFLAEPRQAMDWARRISGTDRYKLVMRVQGGSTDRINMLFRTRMFEPLEMRNASLQVIDNDNN